MNNKWLSQLIAVCLLGITSMPCACAADRDKSIPRDSIQLPLYERFASPAGNTQAPPTEETPSFQRHVSPLFGRLGCNGRACHGSFQGQGGFQLSLFGYDFKADHDALMDAATGRVDLDDKLESLVLSYPVDADAHGGGKRFDEGGWEYWVIRNWIQSGAKFEKAKIQKLERLEVTPKQVRFEKLGDKLQLRAVAHWEDGTSEDVTCLCRFHSNDTAISQIDELGTIASEGVGDTHVVVSYDKAVVPVQTFLPLSDQAGENYPQIAASTKVDKLVIAKLQKLGIVPSELCTDAEFLRRATLDVTGGLPTSAEVQEFLAGSRPDKRQLKIDELLSRPAYAARWTTFFCDMTGNNDDQLRNFLPNGIRVDSQWYHWIRERIENNMPYDELVAGIVTAESRLPGESYRDYCAAMSEVCSDQSGEKFSDRPGLVYYWARRNFQSTEDRAIGFAYTFLGVRIQCAQCHKHPFDQWSKDDFDNFEKLFARVQANQRSMQPDAKREYTKMLSELAVNKSAKGNDLRKALQPLLMDGKTIPFPELIVSQPAARNNNKKKGDSVPPPSRAKLLGSDWVQMDDSDARDYLMDWLRSPENPYFTKAIVNRIWTQYFSVGIINPADDINLANAPSNAPLLDHLVAGFRENDFDLKWLHREILNSDTYQRSWRPNTTNAGDKHNFSRSLLRRMPAETALDAVRMALSDDKYALRAQQLDVPRAHLVAGSSNRQLLNSRDDTSYALNVFGRNVRESNCDCDRSEESSLLQTVFLLNDASIHKLLSDPRSSWVRQVATKFNWPAPSTSAQNDAKQKQFEALLERLETQQQTYRERLSALEGAGQKRQIEMLKKARKQQLAKVRSGAKRLGYEDELEQWVASTEAGAAPSVKELSLRKITDEQAEWVAENAYLRTLNRQPTADELAIATGFLHDDENPTAAVAGLLWSLVNTKEFILNH